MTHHIIRVHLASGTRIIVAARPDAEDAADLVTTLNRHAVGYLFQMESA